MIDWQAKTLLCLQFQNLGYVLSSKFLPIFLVNMVDTRATPYFTLVLLAFVLLLSVIESLIYCLFDFLSL